MWDFFATVDGLRSELGTKLTGQSCWWSWVPHGKELWLVQAIGDCQNIDDTNQQARITCDLRR